LDCYSFIASSILFRYLMLFHHIYIIHHNQPEEEGSYGEEQKKIKSFTTSSEKVG
jgi:hypothetical protein